MVTFLITAAHLGHGLFWPDPQSVTGIQTDRQTLNTWKGKDRNEEKQGHRRQNQRPTEEEAREERKIDKSGNRNRQTR